MLLISIMAGFLGMKFQKMLCLSLILWNQHVMPTVLIAFLGSFDAIGYYEKNNFLGTCCCFEKNWSEVTAECEKCTFYDQIFPVSNKFPKMF